LSGIRFKTEGNSKSLIVLKWNGNTLILDSDIFLGRNLNLGKKIIGFKKIEFRNKPYNLFFQEDALIA